MITILTGDCREVLKTLPDCSVHCCVTSPPYWGLRDYGTAKWEGGDAACDHLGKPMATRANVNRNTGGKDVKNAEAREPMGRTCSKCGARRVDLQIGLERTPEEYVAAMVGVFREVRRVLREDGTVWINLGDSYNAAGRNGHGTRDGCKQGTNRASASGDDENRPTAPGLKPKDLVGIPWRVAFALQADGWYLRQDIIWHKPNPMPESVTDRCTKAHEYIFLLSKSERYWYDADAIKESAADPAREKRCEGENAYRGQAAIRPRGATRRHRKPAGWDTGAGAHGAFHREGRAQKVEYTETEATNRNKRDVWTVPTSPYKDAHFATFPPNLIRPCILAGCPQGGTVLDPFGGSGTTAEVAEEEGRNSTIIELNPAYVALAEKRTAQCGLFCRGVA